MGKFTAGNGKTILGLGIFQITSVVDFNSLIK